MHPKEMSNRALVAASAARLDGFAATADALIALALACEDEARWANDPGRTSGSDQLIGRSLSEQHFLVLLH